MEMGRANENDEKRKSQAKKKQVWEVERRGPPPRPNALSCNVNQSEN